MYIKGTGNKGDNSILRVPSEILLYHFKIIIWAGKNTAVGRVIYQKDKLFRVNPEHKSCFKCVFCFTLRSFSVNLSVGESVVFPLTPIIKNFFHRFFSTFSNEPCS